MSNLIKKHFLLLLIISLLLPGAMQGYASETGGSLIVDDTFENAGQLEKWEFLCASNTYGKIDQNYSVAGKSLMLADKNDNFASPYYEGYVSAIRRFGRQNGKITIEFYAKSDNIPIGHENIKIAAGNTAIGQIWFYNHGQNSHVKLSDGQDFHMLTRQYSNVWNKFKFEIDFNKKTTDFYIDNMDTPVKTVKFENQADYADRIIFETGKQLGEHSTLWIDELKIYGSEILANEVCVENGSMSVAQNSYAQIKAYINPVYATNQSLRFVSGDSAIASVNENGLVYGVKPGETEVSVVSGDGKAKNICKIIVEETKNQALTLQTKFDPNTKKLTVYGLNPNGEKQNTALVVRKENGEIDNLTQIESGEGGKYEISYVLDETKAEKFILTATSGDETATGVFEFEPQTAPEVKISPDFLVLKVNEGREASRLINGNAWFDGNVIWTTSNYNTGFPQAAGSNNVKVFGREEGEFRLTAQTDTPPAGNAAIKVYVNDEKADITQTEDKVCVSLGDSVLKTKAEQGGGAYYGLGFASVKFLSGDIKNQAEGMDSLSVTAEYRRDLPVFNLDEGYKVVSSVGITTDLQNEIPAVVSIPYLNEQYSVDEESLIIGVLNKDNQIEFLDTKTDSANKNAIATVNLPANVYLLEKKSVFSDINGSYAKQDIKKLSLRGVFDYNTTAFYHPDNAVLKGEFIYAAAKAIGFKEADYANSFKDVEGTEFYAGYLQELYEKQIIKGDLMGNFYPDAALTRQEAAVMLARMAEIYQGYEPAFERLKSFTDYQRVESWAVQGVGAMITAGIMKGVSSSLIGADETITNAQAACLISRVIG